MKEAHLFIKADGGFIVEVQLWRACVSIGFGGPNWEPQAELA